MVRPATVSVTYFPTDGEPVEVAPSDDLLVYLRRHGTPIGRVGQSPPGYVILKLTRSMVEAGSGIPQPLLHLLVSLVACHGDGRLLQVAPDLA